MAHLMLGFLGDPQVEVDGVPVKLARHKALALLALLAMTGRPQPREALATLLWTEYDAPSALAYLRRAVWEIGRTIGKEWLVAERETLSLPPSANLWLDVDQFRRRVSRLPAEPVSTTRLAELEEAIRLYRGDFLAGLTVDDAPGFEAWQIQEAEALRRELRQALAALAQGHEHLRQWEAGLAATHRWLAQDELDEAAHQQAMRLYMGLGDRSAALRQFDRCAGLLAAELGARPAPETVELAERIRRGERVTADRPIPILPLPELLTPRHNLPTLPTPFIGRHAELQQIAQHLASADNRLLTLLGPGGSGKTRLAIRAGEAAVGDLFPDGVWFVALTPLQDPAGLEHAVADALQLSLDNERPARPQLLDALHPRRLLLILDNFEHLLPAGAELATAMLAATPGVRLMVTSRTRLNIRGEQLHTVNGLPLPPADATDITTYDAVRLFLQAARRVQPNFGQDPRHLTGVERVCQLVLGMPLGLELAAAWVELLSPPEIADEIERSLDFLSVEWQDTPPGHRTLRAVFNSAWQLLTAEEQAKLKTLSVLRGSFSRPAAEAVADAHPRLLLALLHKSWLQHTAAGRYEIHELLRQYAAEKLAAEPVAEYAARRTHAYYYAAFLKRQQESIHKQQKEVLDDVMAELAQIGAAWVWLVEAAEWARLVDDMLPVLWGVHQASRGVTDIERWLRLADAAPAAGQPNRPERVAMRAARLYCEWRLSGNTSTSLSADDLQVLAERPDYVLWHMLSIVYEAHRMDQYAAGVSLLEALISRLRQGDDRFLLAFALGWLGDFLRHEERFPQAKAVLEESRAIYRPMWPHFGLVGVARWLTDTTRQLGDAAAAQLYRAEAVRVCEQLDMLLPWLIGNEPAEQAFAAGDLAGGIAIFRREQESALQKGDKTALVNSLGWGSIYLARYGALDEALAARQQVLALEEAISADDTLRGWHRLELGEIYRLLGDFAIAQQWYETALAHFEAAQHANGRAQLLRAQADLALARGDYQQAVAGFDACLAHFHKSDWWQAAYAESGLGRAYMGLGAPTQAREHFKVALHHGKSYLGLTLMAVVGLAEVLESEGERMSAASLATFAQRQPALWHETRVRVGALLSRLSAQLPAEAMTEAYAAATRLTLADVHEIASR